MNYQRLVKCSLVDGSILKEYTSMLFDLDAPSGIAANAWPSLGPNNPE